MQLFEATWVRNSLIVKNLEHGTMRKKKDCSIGSLHFEKCYVYFDHTKPCCKLLRQTSKIEKLQTTFRMVLLFQGLPLNTYGVECKENGTM